MQKLRPTLWRGRWEIHVWGRLISTKFLKATTVTVSYGLSSSVCIDNSTGLSISSWLSRNCIRTKWNRSGCDRTRHRDRWQWDCYRDYRCVGRTHVGIPRLQEKSYERWNFRCYEILWQSDYGSNHSANILVLDLFTMYLIFVASLGTSELVMEIRHRNASKPK